MPENLSEVMKEVQEGVTKKTASQKDEIRIMQAMLNDSTFQVGVYNKTGQIGTYSPYQDSRSMIANIMGNATGISNQEAENLANNYMFDKKDASTFVNISKEFINTYMDTGRKLPLGGRENSNVSLIAKQVSEREKQVPIRDNGVTVGTTTVHIPAFSSVRVISPCPSWIQ